MTVPEFLRPWLGSSPEAALVLCGGLALVLLALLLGLWQLFGRGPRRRRAFQRARRLLQRGAWQEALERVRSLQAGRLSAAWQGRLANLEGECHHAAGSAALDERLYEDSLKHFQTAARLLNVDATELRDRVIEAMLADVRARFAAGTDPDALGQLLARILLLRSPCAEALFWQGLCHARAGQSDQALTALAALAASQQEDRQFLDPPLYQGALLLRAGRPQEALRLLAEANRLDPNCPFIAWQLGTAIVASAGDSGLAVRALQKALGPRGFGLWGNRPERAWVEAFPDGRSYVRRLAARHAFACPVFGADLGTMVRQAQQSLAQAHYRLGNFQEAADLYAKLLQDCPPSVPLLRGLGLSLARLERYDQAYKHLRIALEQEEQEEPQDPLTAGYLALCGALGKPTSPADKHKNVAWAIRLLVKFNRAGDPEWARLCSAVFAEARQIGLPVAVEDQRCLCEVLLAVRATDPAAAAAYAHLAGSYPEAVRPEYTWLYGKAAQEHGFASERDLELFDRIFRDEPAARAYYQQQGWDFDEVEYTYLSRCAALRPGAFPPERGPDYAARAEGLLLARSHHQEEARQPDAALASALVLLQLAPHNGRAHDRLAQLHYRRGELDRAAELLASWHRLEPANHWPLARLAVIEQQRGNAEGRSQAIARALELTRGRRRAEIAFLGARLEIASCSASICNLQSAQSLLQECLKDAPDHADALWSLAAVRSVLGDREGLAAQARDMDRTDAADPRFHYLAAVCHLAARDYPRVLETGQRVIAQAERGGVDAQRLAVEAAYLMGWAHLHREDPAAAAVALARPAHALDSSSGEHARALLGRIGFCRGDYEDAVTWWSTLDAGRREQWLVDAPLRATVFLSGLLAYQAGRFEQAAQRFREAGQLGLRERGLGSLLALAYFKAGQRLLYQAEETNHLPTAEVVEAIPLGKRVQPPFAAAAELLEKAGRVGGQDPNVHYLLALAHKRQGKTAEARDALRKISRPDAGVFLQMGLLSLRESQPAQAEEEFARAWEMDDTSYPAGFNLLMTRLTLGKIDDSLPLLGRLLPLAPSPDEQHFLAVLEALLQVVQSAGQRGEDAAPPEWPPGLGELTATDEQRLLKLTRGLGDAGTAYALLRALAAAHPRRPVVQEAYVEATLAHAKDLLDRCRWDEAERLLGRLTREHVPLAAASRPTLAVLQNLLGCCSCLNQDFAAGVRHFTAALKLAGNDARLHQNLALTHELQDQLSQAEPHWNRYFDLLDGRLPSPPGQPDYAERLAYEGLTRLANRFSRKERWQSALGYGQRAHRLRPRDADTVELLFHLYNQAKRPQDARRALQQLRELRPNEPQYDLYELDLIEVKGLGDIDRMLAEIDRILKRYPGDARVEERGIAMVGNVIPLMGNLCNQLTDQLSKVIDQVRNVPSYQQVNWPAVREVMRDLQREFVRLRRITTKCLPLVTQEEHGRIIRELTEHIDRKIEVCREMGA